ncbi:MBL fold metallo-hydrolase [bacterium 1xD42-62]|uniref:MBL fold metallo-hydrolase n=2 Tax=Parablautia muri TaxID=2320879 RepID=A0A9X5BG08_9FIRM|nr:MBL fold metallo-hydrolase [Parablautia muri]
MVKVTYLYHSGFMVELDNSILIFDYFKGNLPSSLKGKKLLMFFSHKHHDHFQLSALKWAEEMSKEAHFFVGNDIKLNGKYLERNGLCPAILKRIERMQGGAVYENKEEQLKVETLHSTDEGVAFVVTAGETSIYHAGDLNNWYWPEETKIGNEKMEKAYKKEIDKIAGRHFDLAFVPLDPRLKEGYGLGMDYFLEKVDADRVFPMHMWEEYDVIKRYKQTKTGRAFAERIEDVPHIPM